VKKEAAENETLLFPPSTRVLGIVALKNHLALDCEIQPIDFGRADQLTPQYLALNKKCQRCRYGFVLLDQRNSVYMAARGTMRHGA
jgi:glutathione S-transferase